MCACSSFQALPGIKGKKEPETRVGLDDTGLPIHSPTLVQIQLASGLQHRVQAIKHSRVAQVGTV